MSLASVYFYDHPTEKVFKDGEPTDEPKLYFHLEKAAITQPAVAFEFDGPATEQHKAEYKVAFADYLKAKAPAEPELQEA